MDLNDRLNDLENRLKQAENENIVVSEQIPKEDKIVQSSGNSEPQMTQEQANAVINVAKNTKDFINVKLSQKANDLIERDNSVKERFTDLAKDTVQQSINTFDTKNRLESKKNYYELNEKDVTSLGGDKTSTKGQQFSIVLIKRFFWILFMATLGVFYIAPLSVIIELFQGISFRNVEKEEYTSENEKKIRWIVKRHKLGIVGTVVGWLVGLAYCVLETILIVHYSKMSLIVAGVIFVLLLIINIAFSISKNIFRNIFRKINRGEKNNVVEIQEESE